MSPELTEQDFNPAHKVVTNIQRYFDMDRDVADGVQYYVTNSFSWQLFLASIIEAEVAYTAKVD